MTYLGLLSYTRISGAYLGILCYIRVSFSSPCDAPCVGLLVPMAAPLHMADAFYRFSFIVKNSFSKNSDFIQQCNARKSLTCCNECVLVCPVPALQTHTSPHRARAPCEVTAGRNSSPVPCGPPVGVRQGRVLSCLLPEVNRSQFVSSPLGLRHHNCTSCVCLLIHVGTCVLPLQLSVFVSYSLRFVLMRFKTCRLFLIYHWAFRAFPTASA